MLKTQIKYYKEKDKYFTAVNILAIFIFLIFFGSILYIFIQREPTNNWVNYLILFSIIGIAILHFSKFRTHKRPSINSGEIEFGESTILINDKSIPIETIESLEINISDYYRKILYRNKFDFRGIYSEGLDNNIEIATKSNQIIKAQFQLKDKKQKYGLKEFYVSCIKQNLLKLNVSHEILDLKNFKDVQKFKKEHGLN